MRKINTHILVSNADFFDDGLAINAHMDEQVPVDSEKAKQEHAEILKCFRDAGIEVVQVKAPENCQDGVYTANWGLVRDNKVVLSNLPNKRQAEQAHAEKILREQGKEIIKLPEEIPFSGQGDALPCGKYLFVGSHYRTGVETHPLLARDLGFNVVSLQTVPQYDDNQQPVINDLTGWPDSFFYDLDLALAIIKGPSDQKCTKCQNNSDIHTSDDPGAHTSDDSVFSPRETQQSVLKYGDESIAEEKLASADEDGGVSGSATKQTVWCECQGMIAWCPEAFMPESQERIRSITDIGKIEVSLEEAMHGFALNLVSTGETVIMSNKAPEFQKKLEDIGLKTCTPEVTELLKGGGFIRCISLTL